MKEKLQALLMQTIKPYLQEAGPNNIGPAAIHIEATRHPDHGDLSSNIAMVLAKSTPYSPQVLAQRIVDALPKHPMVLQAKVAGPGFINFFLAPDANLSCILDILQEQDQYGSNTLGKGQSVLIEFVSANPTGPLHVGHGRGATYGAALAKLMRKNGFQVDCEYYINDAGRQMDILTISVWLRYLALIGEKIAFPHKAYQGDYIQDMAVALLDRHGWQFSQRADLLPPPVEEDDERQIDRMIEYAQRRLGEDDYNTIHDHAGKTILANIRQDLDDFGIAYQNWFSERTLIDKHKIEQCIDILKEKGYCYQKDGATWFRSSQLGDEKDRVLIRETGQATYFATDIAYHKDKFERGYDRLINIWGADHHGYINRLKAALQALGKPADRLRILLVQFVTLYRGTQKIQMSTRTGQFITLKALYEEVGKDASHLFYIMRKSERHLDFDLELAKSTSNENPVYYIQYAHARIHSVLKKQTDPPPTSLSTQTLAPLTQQAEQKLLAQLVKYPEVITSSATQLEPHQLAHYLCDLANDFHSYYNSYQFLVPDQAIRQARIALIEAIRITIADGLSLLGISAPKSM